MQPFALCKLSYVSVVTFDGAVTSLCHRGDNSKIRTAATSTGSVFTRTGAAAADTSSLPSFAGDLYFTVMDSGPTFSSCTAGFVNVSERTNDLKNCIPDYPYSDTAPNAGLDAGMRFPFDANGTASNAGFMRAYDLMTQTYVGNPDADKAKRYVIFLGDGEDNNLSSSLETAKYTAALKAPRYLAGTTAVLMLPSGYQGINSQVWSIGLGLNYTAACDYSTASWGMTFQLWVQALDHRLSLQVKALGQTNILNRI